MDLMLDPACEYETFADALKVGRACDEHDFLWYEDAYRDTGVSQHSHWKLRELLNTPLLQTEHVRGLRNTPTSSRQGRLTSSGQIRSTMRGSPAR